MFICLCIFIYNIWLCFPFMRCCVLFLYILSSSFSCGLFQINFWDNASGKGTSLPVLLHASPKPRRHGVACMAWRVGLQARSFDVTGRTAGRKYASERQPTPVCTSVCQ